ncbi:hypothetical protein [Limnobaculum parvum]|uniref:Uncharacterized protein n=1 Tax=Limnobaculum parvum TaxID=2172103 RepID=A0A2Y9TVY8_9GAMM|nr:hypothetical protein [Limnobaculum parvum]AWH87877.1 hypothetical protein HYN51_04470 [Limnobaculum parvum]
MKKLIPLILIPLLQACGDAGSDTELPTIKAKSAYTCSQYNEYRIHGDKRSQSNIKNATIQQLDAIYTGNTLIEKYYQSLFSRNRQVNLNNMKDDIIYDMALDKKIDDICLNSTDSNLTDAITSAINKLYVEMSNQPQLATCQSYIENKISYKDILVKATEEKYYRIINPANKITHTQGYGEEFIETKLKESCSKSPQKRLWTIAEWVVSSYEFEISKKEDAQQKQEQEKARLKFELETYGVSLFKTGNADCRDYQTQYEKSQQPGEHQAQYKAALLSTLTDAGELLTPRQRVVFDKLLADNPEGFAAALLEATRSGHLGSSPCYKERKGERRKGVELKDAIESMDNIPAAIEPKPLTQNQLVPLGR